MGFAVGKFTGKVAESDTAFFHAQIKQVSAYDEDFTNKKLEDLPAGKKLVNIEENYKKIQRQAASIPQAIKRRQQKKEREELF